MQQQVQRNSDWVGTVPPEAKVAVIIPLYGYWSELPVPQMTAQVLQVLLLRLKCYRNKMYFIFVGESNRLEKDVRDIIAGKKLGGDTRAIAVEAYASYNEYIVEGLNAILEDTDSQFVLVANPWIMLKDGVVDEMVERLNRKDVGIVSGFDTRSYKHAGGIGIPAEQLDTYQFNPPVEDNAFDWNFWGMTRQTAEMFKLDPEYQTHYFSSVDSWAYQFSAGMTVITSQFLPFYSFDIDWKLLESEEDFQKDYQRFLTKWKFDPSINY